MVDILFVEDNPDDAELTLRALGKIDLIHGVHHVHDGAEAIDYIYKTQAHKFLRLILLDHRMPKVDGLELLRRIKRDPLLQQIPVVVLTSSRDGHHIVECYKLGANAYMTKPIDYDAFEREISEVALFWMGKSTDSTTMPVSKG